MLVKTYRNGWFVPPRLHTIAIIVEYDPVVAVGT